MFRTQKTLGMMGGEMPSDGKLDAQISELHFDVTLFRFPEGEIREHFRNVARNVLRHFHDDDDGATTPIK